MVIGIDASRAGVSDRMGTENYSFNLIRYLAAIDKKNEYILYSREPLTEELAPENLGTNFRNRVISWPILWTQGGLAGEMVLGRRPDVLFVPAHVMPWNSPKNTVVTVHGLEYEYCPENYTMVQKAYLRFGTAFSASRARKVIVPSENTKKDLIKFYRLAPEKIEVVHHGASLEDASPNGRSGGGIASKYIMFVGRLEARKNIVRLIKAFGLFKKTANGSDWQLVLAGRPGIGFEEIDLAIRKSPVKSDIILKNYYVSSSEKRDLLRRAAIAAYVPLYEGFGLPVLEAQAAGVPVIASDVSAVPEVAGQGALLVDPNDSDKIYKALKSVSGNNELRKKLIEAGFKNIQRFSWKQCAKETLDILTKL